MDVSHEIVCDAQVVQHGSGIEALAMVQNEMRGAGIPTWDDWIRQHGDGRLGSRDIAYVLNTDAGPDEIYYRKLVGLKCEEHDWLTVWPISCFKHQAHIIVEGGLKIIDKALADGNYDFRYFSSITKIVQCWRADAGKIFNAWCTVFSNGEALRVCKKLPPRAISGRWGSVTDAEAHLIGADPFRFGKVAGNVWARRKDGHLSGSNVGNAEESDDYKARMGRWRRDTLQVCSNPLFHAILIVAHEFRNPVTHFMAFLDKKYETGEVAEHGTKLFQLICGKAEKFQFEFQSMLADDHHELWTRIACLELCDADYKCLKDLSARLATHALAAFEHRIKDVTMGDPWYVLQLVRSIVLTDYCDHRKRIASEILGTDDAKLHINVRKLKRRACC